MNTKLFHATYEPLLDDIARDGLGATDRTNWPGSQSGVVYLSERPGEAESFAEIAPDVPEEWLDRIVVLSVSADALSQSKLQEDRANRDSQATTFEYQDIVPPELLSVHSTPGRKTMRETLRQEGS